MIKILFICHGNICRSPMAEFVFRDMVTKIQKEKEFFVASAATSREEIGNPVHSKTKGILKQYGISAEGKRAIQLTKEDYTKYDYLIGMEQRNIINMLRILGEDKQKKISRLLDFSRYPKDIADPWYTQDFETTYKDISEGCTDLLEFILKLNKR